MDSNDRLELEDFPPDIHRYPYKGRDDFLRIHESFLPNGPEYFLMTNVDKDSFERDFVNTDEGLFIRAWNEYCFSTKSLLIRMPPCEFHASAVGSFTGEVLMATRELGPKYRLVAYGDRAINIGGKSLAVDGGFVLKSDPNRRVPTVVFEVGLSESGTHMQRKIDFWLTQSNGLIQAVVFIRLRREWQVVLQRWGISNGAPAMEQETIIEKIYGRKRSDPSTVQVTNAPFIIPFNKLYLRDPLPNSRERDIHLSQESLELMFTDIWR